MTSARRLSLLLSAATLATTLASAQTTGPYKILNIAKIGGDGGWDYLTADATSRQLYIARSGPTGNLHVYNLDTLAPLGDIPLGSSHGAASCSVRGKGSFARGRRREWTRYRRSGGS